MVLAQAWDKAALVADLKLKGVADAEKLVQDILDSCLDWSVASCQLQAQTQPIYGLGAIILPEIKTQVDSYLAGLPAKV